MTVDEAAEERRVALNRVDELQRQGELSKSESQAIREDLHEAMYGEEIIDIYENYLGTNAKSPDWSDPGRPKKELSDGFLDALDAIYGPATTSEIADELDESYRLVTRRLEELAEDGLVEQKTIGGRIRIWWPRADSGQELASDMEAFAHDRR